MKITGLKIRGIKVPFNHPYALSKAYGVQVSADNVILELLTDEGVTGWGECDPMAAFTGDTLESVIALLSKCIAPQIIGKDPTDITGIHQIMNGTLRANSLTKAAVDIACHDILGKVTGLPVCKLIGRQLREEIPCFWAIGGGTPEVIAKQITSIKEAGYWGCMIKVGNDPENDARRTIAARMAVGREFPLIADANQGWSMEETLRYGDAIKDVGLLFLEQPIAYWDIDGLAEVRKRLPFPISADESLTDVHDAQRLIEAGACDYFSIKVAKQGGLIPARAICDYAGEHGVKLFFNSMHEEGITQAASFHLATTVPNLLASTGHSFFSTMRLENDITDFHEWTARGMTTLREKSGLGVSINTEMLDRYTVVQENIGG